MPTFRGKRVASLLVVRLSIYKKLWRLLKVWPLHIIIATHPCCNERSLHIVYQKYWHRKGHIFLHFEIWSTVTAIGWSKLTERSNHSSFTNSLAWLFQFWFNYDFRSWIVRASNHIRLSIEKKLSKIFSDTFNQNSRFWDMHLCRQYILILRGRARRKKFDFLVEIFEKLHKTPFWAVFF